MKVAIRYYSKAGNTKKLADVIGQVLNVDVKDTSSPLEEKVDLLFLGSAVYAAGIDDAVKSFIKNNASKISKIVNFSTAAVAKGTYKQVQKVAGENGVQMSDMEFHCKGSFGIMNRNRPNEEDINNLKAFVSDVMKKNEV